MLLFLLLVTVSVAFAEEANTAEEPVAAESSHRHEHSYSDGLELIRERNRQIYSDRFRDYDHHTDAHRGDEHDIPGPVILRTPHPLPTHGAVDIEAQNRIIEDVYSPDYSQPTWVLDYRYLKTGGRDYVRGPGGQILILPKGVRSKEPKEFPDYDAYLEHLRLSRLAKEKPHKHDHDRRHDDESYHEDEHEDGHGQTKWRKY